MIFYKRAVEIINSKIKNRVLTLNFSEVIEQPYKELQKIAAFLSVDLQVHEDDFRINFSKSNNDYDKYIEYLMSVG
jgi:hypothetical protein